MKSKKILLVLGFLTASIIFSSCVTFSNVVSVATSVAASQGLIDWRSANAINSTATSFEKAVQQFTPEMQYYLGRTVASTILSSYQLLDAPEMTEYLNKICTTLTMSSPMPYLYKGYWVAILDTDEINAMATPGGHIFISKGLIKSVDSEDALASVIAHELSHIQLNHSIKAIQASRGTEVAFNLVNTAVSFSTSEVMSDEAFESFSMMTESISSVIMNEGFSKSQEFDADKNALTLMNNAGYNPVAMVDMLTLIKKDSVEGGWNKTHPSPTKRIESVKKNLKKIKFKGTPIQVRLERFNSEKFLFINEISGN